MIKVFYGPDAGFTLHKAQGQLKETFSEVEYREVIRFDGYKDPTPSVIEDCSSISLFGDRKIVLFSNCYFLSSDTGKKATFKESEQNGYKALLEYFESPNEDTVLYMVCDGELKKSGELYTALNDSPAVELVCCTLPTEEEYFLLANKMALEENKSISKDAINEVINRSKTISSGGYNQKSIDYLTFTHNIEKLLLYKSDIQLCDVIALVYRPLEDNVFEIVSALMNRDTKKALKIYDDVLSGGIEPLNILPAFASKFRDYALVKYLIEEKENNDHIAEILSSIQGKKIKPGAIYYRRKEVEMISFSSLLRILSDLGKMEDDIKRQLDDADVRMKYFISQFYVDYLAR